MKYIHIVQFHLMSGGGVGSVITDLCEAMAQKSDEVYAVSLFQREGIDFNEELKWASQTGVHSILIQESPKESPLHVLFALRREINKLAKNDKCVLFLHLKWGVLAGILASLMQRNVKRVEVYHSGYIHYKLQAFFSKPFIDKYIAVSKDAERQLVDDYHIQKGKIDVVYNGVDVNRIQTIARGIDHSQTCFTFASVGRLSFEKGFKTSIQAYAEIRNNGMLSNTSYIMVGTGNQMNECISLSKSYVSFKGLVEREVVYHYIGESDIMILPSLWEGNSILMLEVLALGKPMILTDIPSFREVLGFQPLSENETIREEWFGVVFRKESIQSCMQAIRYAYSIRSSFPEMSTKIRSLGETFSTEHQASRYLIVANSLF